MRPIYPLNGQKGRHHSLVYLGIMGPQDGVDLVLRVMADLVHRRGRRDVHVTLLGFGDCLEALQREATRLNLDQWVTFTGRADKSMIADHLSAADVGLCPDLKTPLNDVSTMNKTMEYMAHALPSVSFDLVETRVSGGDSVLYVPSGDEVAFADAVERLLDDPELRVQMGLKARSRVAEELDWRPQAERYVTVFEDLTGWPSLVPALRFTDERCEDQESDHGGRAYVDLTDAVELRRFIQERSSRELERQP